MSDFNLSKLMADTPVLSSAHHALNPRWLAPEVLLGEQATALSVRLAVCSADACGRGRLQVLADALLG